MSLSEQRIYIDEASGNQRRYRRFVNFTHSSTKGAATMLLCAIVAVCVASSPLAGEFRHFWHAEIVVGFGAAHASMGLGHVINDLLMALFFLLVGMEVKYEFTVGELSDIRQALLPIAAAFGGVFMPITIYLAFNARSPSTIGGWGVPTATDIAFALGIVSLLGPRVPNGVKVFLSTLAVADDIMAIVIIAVFYGQNLMPLWLGVAALVYVVLIFLNKAHVYSLVPYLAGGVLLWYCVFASGVHSTIAGVLLAFVIPSCSHVDLHRFIGWSRENIDQAGEVHRPSEPVIAQKGYLETVGGLSRVAKHVIPPAVRLEHALYPWVYFFVLPLFALSNADVVVSAQTFGQALANPAFLGAFFGLLLGKPLGVLLASFLVVKVGKVRLPEHTNWGHIAGAAVLAGMGFTMAIFVANLAYSDAAIISIAKVAILASSLLAGLVGFTLLSVQARKAKEAGIGFVQTSDENDDSGFLTADQEDLCFGKECLIDVGERKRGE